MHNPQVPHIAKLLVLAIFSAAFTHASASPPATARSPDPGRGIFPATFVPVCIQDSGCSPVLWSTPSGSTWGGCVQSTACNGECVHESESQGVNTIHWCDCPEGEGIGCYAEVTVDAAGMVIDVWCDEISCEICTVTERPVPLPEGPNVKYRACSCPQL
ncbi:MAG: hypothetical protein IT457_24055 [Planctomycetes bacterium]|nr:hypothetical protein [Planctomycetota bacterium]